MNSEYLIVKLGSTGKVKFYEEHLKVIEQYGFVDFARVGKRKIVFQRVKEPFFFLKESENSGGKIIKSYFLKDDIKENERKYPSYYAQMQLQDATWVRITKMEIMDKNSFLKTYSLLNGNDIKALDKGAIPFFYVKEKEFCME